MKTVLLCENDDLRAKNITEYLEKSSFETKRSTTGRDCQLSVYKNKYHAVIINMAIRDHGPLSVLKYLSLNHIPTRVLLIFNQKKLFEELGYSLAELKKMGANEIIVEPKSSEVIVNAINALSCSEEWKNVKAKEDNDSPNIEIKAYDETFTKIKMDDFYVGKISVFDYYLKLAKNRYVKVLNKGERFDHDRFNRYLKDDRIEHLYFQTKDRVGYINYMNQVCAKLESCPTMKVEAKVSALNNVVDKFMEEIYVSGINEDLVNEGLQISETVYKVVQSSPEMNKMLRNMTDLDPKFLNHSFLTTLFSTIIAKNLDWPTKKTNELLCLGSFFHDLGKIKLPKAIREKKIEELKEAEIKQYHHHCQFGIDLLGLTREIPEAVKLIAYQHHESVSGGGYPRGISGSKIFPLAKIVALADTLAYMVIDGLMPPLQAYQKLISDQKLVINFEGSYLKSFAQSLIMEKK